MPKRSAAHIEESTTTKRSRRLSDSRKPTNEGAATKNATVPVLTAAKSDGQGDEIARLFKYGNIDVVFHQIEEVEAAKMSPTGLLPMLQIRGQCYCEYLAIVLYVAERVGLQPADPVDQMRVVTIVRYIERLRPLVDRASALVGTLSQVEATRELSSHLNRLEHLVLGGFRDGYCVNGRLSAADFAVASVVELLQGRSKDLQLSVGAFGGQSKLEEVRQTLKKRMSAV